MNERYSFEALVRLVLKRWKITLLFPLIICLFTFAGGKYLSANNPEYNSTATFVIATKNSENQAENVGYQNNVFAQTYNENMVKTMTKLMTSTSVLSSVIKSLEGRDTYTKEQLQSLKVPNLRENIDIRTENGSVIGYVSVNDKKATSSAKVANEIIKQTQISEAKIWGTKNLKFVNKATAPLNKKQESNVKYALISFVVAVVIMSLVVVLIDALRRKES